MPVKQKTKSPDQEEKTKQFNLTQAQVDELKNALDILKNARRACNEFDENTTFENSYVMFQLGKIYSAIDRSEDILIAIDEVLNPCEDCDDYDY
jgi:hypothetical protein